MSNNVTMKDIAMRLGVSNVTVSKALNDKEGVSDELKLKIKEVAEEMGYRINSVAKSMKEGTSYNIGVIIPDRFVSPQQSFYVTFYQYITKVLESYGYSGILHILSEEHELEGTLPRMYYERKVDGFILLGQIDSTYANLFTQHEIPHVFLDFYTGDADVDSVITDNFYGMYEMTNYLIHQGHRDIAFVGNIHSTSSIQDRYLGYYKSLLEHKMELNPAFVISDRDEKGRYIELDLPNPLPTAFVCNCDEIAFNLVTQLKREGISVPEDCSIVGFDNDIFSTLSDPKLTTVAVDLEEMSKTAVRFIIKKVKSPERTFGRVAVKGKLVFRESVKEIMDKEEPVEV